MWTQAQVRTVGLKDNFLSKECESLRTSRGKGLNLRVRERDATDMLGQRRTQPVHGRNGQHEKMVSRPLVLCPAT